jgi:hypothetical protein
MSKWQPISGTYEAEQLKAILAKMKALMLTWEAAEKAKLGTNGRPS